MPWPRRRTAGAAVRRGGPEARLNTAHAQQIVGNLIEAEHPGWASRNLWSPSASVAVSGVTSKLGLGGVVVSGAHSLRGGVQSNITIENLKSRLDWLEKRCKILEARLAQAGGVAPPTRDRLGPPSPHRVYVDRVVRVDVPARYVVRQRAEGGFALRVVNERREAVAQARAWSGRLRTLDAERARRLADPAAAKGPGTPAWDELGQQIAHARAGLANAVTALWGQAAAQAAVAESEAQALPLSMAAWQRSRSTPAPTPPPPPAGPAAGDAAPGSISTSGPGAVMPSPSPPPVAEADMAAVCEAFEEGLLAALRAAR